MATQNLSAEELRTLTNYDPETGVFTRLYARRGPKLDSNVMGTKNRDGYLFSMIHRRTYALHRLAWLYVYGEWPDGEVDHINGNRADNRIQNLRKGDKSLNQQNRRVASKNSQSGFLGVHWCAHRNKWRAAIYINGRNKSLGRYETAEEAHAAYVAAKRLVHAGGTI